MSSRGASSTLMQEIAQGYVPLYNLLPNASLTRHSLYQDIQLVSQYVFCRGCTRLTIHSQHFNEIMPAIYARFMEKEARQWRQIYKVSFVQ